MIVVPFGDAPTYALPLPVGAGLTLSTDLYATKASGPIPTAIGVPKQSPVQVFPSLSFRLGTCCLQPGNAACSHFYS